MEEHKPVLSTRTQGHALYTKFNFAEPFGKLVLCHRMCSGQLHSKAGRTTVKITCMTCGSTCTVPKVTTDRTTTLGRRRMVKIPYPQEQFPTEWKLPQPGAKFTQPLHPTTPPAQDSQVAMPLVHKSQDVAPSLQNPEVPTPPVQMPHVATPPGQTPQTTAPPVQTPRVVTRSSKKVQPVPPPVAKAPPMLTPVREALRRLSSAPLMRTRSLPVASGSTPPAPTSSDRLVIRLPGRSLAHSQSTSNLPDRPAETPDPEASSTATRRKRPTTVTSSSSNPKRSKKTSSSGIR